MPAGKTTATDAVQAQLTEALTMLQSIQPTVDSYPRLPGTPTAADIISTLQLALTTAKGLSTVESDLEACKNALIVANGRSGPPVATAPAPAPVSSPTNVAVNTGVSTPTAAVIGLVALGAGFAGGFALGKKKR